MHQLPGGQARMCIVRFWTEECRCKTAGSYIRAVVSQVYLNHSVEFFWFKPVYFSEHKIDQIAKRLDGIESLVGKINNTLTKQSEIQHTSTPIQPCTESQAKSREDAPDSDLYTSAFNGPSSMAGHTAFAGEVVDQAMAQRSPQEHHLKMDQATSCLRQIIEKQQQRSARAELCFPNRNPLSTGGFRDLPLPPTQIVLEMIRSMKGNGEEPWLSIVPN
jgi:hypothetical protein